MTAMYFKHMIEGKYVNLKPVDEDDAEFTLKIRNDETLTQFIPKVSISLEEQKKWIQKQREKTGDYFFVIMNKQGTKLGTASLYNIENGQCEFGRYISYGSAIENVETAILLLDIAFSMSVHTVIFNIDIRNIKIIRLWKQFGAVYIADFEREGWTAAQYHLIRQDYSKNREKIVKMLSVGE